MSAFYLVIVVALVFALFLTLVTLRQRRDVLVVMKAEPEDSSVRLVSLAKGHPVLITYQSRFMSMDDWVE